MRVRAGGGIEAPRLSGRERGAIAEFLAYFEDRVRGVEPGCADLLHRARLALYGLERPDAPGRTTH